MSGNLWSLYENISDTFDKKDIENKKDTSEICISCNYKCDFKLEDGYKWCNLCGENNGIQIDTSAEWRYYGSEDSKTSDPTRCGITNNNLLKLYIK